MLKLLQIFEEQTQKKLLQNSKNSKIKLLRKLLDAWVPGHIGIQGNEIADEKAKASLENNLLATEKYPPQDLITWIKIENMKTRKTRWQNSENDMKFGKKRDRME
jgi:hypothetical protein